MRIQVRQQRPAHVEKARDGGTDEELKNEYDGDVLGLLMSVFHVPKAECQEREFLTTW